MGKLITFNGDPTIKDKYLKRIKEHQLADNIMQTATGEGGKGCAVWCTLDRYDHNGYETELGIPKIFAYLEDRIFERMSVEDSKPFPYEYLSAVPVGKTEDEMMNVYGKLFVWTLTDEKDGVINHPICAKDEKLKKFLQELADLTTKVLSGEITREEGKDRADRAYRAYRADRADRAYRADRADRAYRAYRAYLADRADLAYRATPEYYKRLGNKMIELLKELDAGSKEV